MRKHFGRFGLVLCMALAFSLLAGCLPPGDSSSSSKDSGQPAPDLSLREWWEGYGHALLWSTEGHPERLFGADGSPDGDSALYYCYFRMMQDGLTPTQVTIDHDTIGHSFAQSLVEEYLQQCFALTAEQAAEISPHSRAGSPQLVDGSYLFPHTLGEGPADALLALEEAFSPKQVEIFRENGREVAQLTIDRLTATYLDEYVQYTVRFEASAGHWQLVSVSGVANADHGIAFSGEISSVRLGNLSTQPQLLDSTLSGQLFLLFEQDGHTQLAMVDTQLQPQTVYLPADTPGETFLSLSPVGEGVVVRSSSRALLYNRRLELLHWITLPDWLAEGQPYDLSDELNTLLAVQSGQLVALDLVTGEELTLFNPAELPAISLSQSADQPAGQLALTGECWLLGSTNAAALAEDESGQRWLCLTDTAQAPQLYPLSDLPLQYTLLDNRWLLGQDPADPSSLWWMDITSGSHYALQLSGSQAPSSSFVPAWGYRGSQIAYFAQPSAAEEGQSPISRLYAIDLANQTVLGGQAAISNTAPQLLGILADGRVLARYQFFEESAYFVAQPQ